MKIGLLTVKGVSILMGGLLVSTVTILTLAKILDQEPKSDLCAESPRLIADPCLGEKRARNLRDQVQSGDHLRR